MIVENDENYWQSDLSFLGIDCKRKIELNDKEELRALAVAIREVYFQDYKTAYNNDSHRQIDKLHFVLHHY
jgi:hypothetical protein